MTDFRARRSSPCPPFPSLLELALALALLLKVTREKQDIVWQDEMERGFSKMMQAMEVYLQDGAGWEELKASTKNYAP